MPTQPPFPPERNTSVKFVFPFWFKVISIMMVVLLAGILIILLSGFLGGVSKEHKEEFEFKMKAGPRVAQRTNHAAGDENMFAHKYFILAELS
ncbi:MAG: hypothetical protein ABSA77_01265 [Thermoguttaceae bacterium]